MRYIVLIIFFNDEYVVIDRQSLFEKEKTVNEISFRQCLIQYDRIFNKHRENSFRIIEKKRLFFSICSMSLLAF